MAYGQKIIDRIGEATWVNFKASASEYLARQAGTNIESVDWVDVIVDGPKDPEKVDVNWKQYDETGAIEITATWRGASFSDVLQPIAKDTGFVDAQTGEQVSQPVDTGFRAPLDPDADLLGDDDKTVA